jgi:hypothetical protein
MSKEISPSIWLGPDCGLLIYTNTSEIGKTTVYQICNNFFDNFRLYSIKGEIFTLEIINFPKINILEKILSYAIYNRNIDLEFELKLTGKISLDELKQLILQQSEKDPGDVMWQFVEPEEIKTEVPKLKSFNDLFRYCEDRILGGNVE